MRAIIQQIRLRTIICGLLFFSVGLICASQDETDIFLSLTNGDQISGKVVAESDETITIENEVFGILVVPKTSITEFGTHPFNIQELTPSTEQEDPPAPKLEKKETEKLPRRWKFSAEAGAEVRSSNTDQRSAHARIRIDYTKNRFRGRGEYQADFARVDGTVTSSKWDGFTRGEYDFPRKRLYTFIESRSRFDLLRDIQLTLEPNLGLGYKFFNRENFILRADLGVNYVNQTRTNGDVTSDYGLTFGQNLMWKISSKLKFEQNLAILPQFLNTQENFVRFDMSLRVFMTDHLFVNLYLLNIYDPTPAPGIPPEDFTFRTSIGFTY
jgi:putative salt-induced outer membrane protein YdiY